MDLKKSSATRRHWICLQSIKWLRVGQYSAYDAHVQWNPTSALNSRSLLTQTLGSLAPTWVTLASHWPSSGLCRRLRSQLWRGVLSLPLPPSFQLELNDPDFRDTAMQNKCWFMTKIYAMGAAASCKVKVIYHTQKTDKTQVDHSRKWVHRTWRTHTLE